MIKRIINQKIKTLTKEDIFNFANANHLSLTEEEGNFILNFIQCHPTLIYQNLDTILSVIRKETSASLYQKVKPLVQSYYQKYKNYL